MADEDYKSPCNRLSAKELMLTRGIRAEAYDEFARSSLVLPKCGEKLFEPNGSWLQEKQISTNLENMRDCLKIERVNRLSQLGSAEWLPNERRALVTKRSGIEWNNYGIAIGKNLYLIPEEALLLLEMNCLELVYKGLSLSIQQAYTLLLESPHSEVTLSEYQVFSHLSRLGYRLQRFHYDRSLTPPQESQPKKKLIIPENGQWTDEKPRHRRPSTPEKIDPDVLETLTTLLSSIPESLESIDNSGNAIEVSIVNGDSPASDLKDAKKPKISKLEIVCEETVIDPIKIIRSPETPKWTAARIQRNVKQLPRRNDKRKNVLVSPEKTIADSSVQSKRRRHEVIDLSDDDVQEISIIPSRTDLLNQFPNTADTGWIRVTNDFIPMNIHPHKQMYKCDRKHLDVVYETDKALRSSTMPESRVVPYNSYNHRFRGNGSWRSNFRGMGFNPSFGIRRDMRNPLWAPGGSWLNRMENISIGQAHSSVFASRWSYQQVNVFRNSMVFGCSIAAAGFYNSVNFCNNVIWQAQNLLRGRGYDSRRQLRGARGMKSLPPTSPSTSSITSSLLRPPASSWTELKQKLKEAKTITIDDDDDRMDCSEVEENIQPLVGPKHAGNITEVFERLQIIKSAQEKTVRKKRGDHKISYKVYPNNTMHFRKSCPGAPLFNIVVTSYQKAFPQPVELNRLQQDGNSSSIVFAVVSRSSTTYLQTGVIALPNLSNE